MITPFNAKTTYMLAPQRHGSNKTQALLTTHHESMFGPFPPVLRSLFGPLQEVLGNDLLEAMVANANLSPRALSLLDESSISANEVREVMTESGFPPTVLGIMSGLYRTGAIRDGRPESRILCKSPDNLELFDEIVANVPDATFVHVVRDPRAVWNSGQGTARGPQTPYAAAMAWNEYHGKVVEISDRFLIHSLRFEDLLTQPETELREACTFLDIAFEPAMLNAHDSAGARAAARSSQDLWGNLDKPIVSARARAWEHELVDRDVEIVENVCGKLMQHFGYDRTRAERPLSAADIDCDPVARTRGNQADPRHAQTDHIRQLYDTHGLSF